MNIVRENEQLRLRVAELEDLKARLRMAFDQRKEIDKRENERLRAELSEASHAAAAEAGHANALKARIEAALALTTRYLSLPGCPDMLATFAMKVRSALRGES